MLNVYWRLLCADANCVLMLPVYWYYLCTDATCILMLPVRWCYHCADAETNWPVYWWGLVSIVPRQTAPWTRRGSPTAASPPGAAHDQNVYLLRLLRRVTILRSTAAFQLSFQPSPQHAAHDQCTSLASGAVRKVQHIFHWFSATLTLDSCDVCTSFDASELAFDACVKKGTLCSATSTLDTTVLWVAQLCLWLRLYHRAVWKQYEGCYVGGTTWSDWLGRTTRSAKVQKTRGITHIFLCLARTMHTRFTYVNVTL